jgi:hypothetical protein
MQAANTDYFHTLIGFKNVSIYSNGGADTATFKGSGGNDVFTGSPTESSLASSGFSVSAKGFAAVTATAVDGGDDRAFLTDSAGNDAMTGLGNSAELTKGSGNTLDYLIKVLSFDQVKATATTGTNTKDVHSDLALLSYILELEGNWQNL